MRVRLVFPDIAETTSLGRETILIAQTLVDAGAVVELLQRPGAEIPGTAQRFLGDAAPAHTRSRVGAPVAAARWARAAADVVRRERASFDVVCTVGTATWEQDLLRVHAVIRAEQARWPERGGRDYRFARARALVAPVLRPQIAAERAIQRLQLRRGFARALAVTNEVAADLAAQGVDERLIEVITCLIDYDRFAGVSSELPAGERRRLVFIGNDFERKGLAVAVRALAALPDEVVLDVVGGGDSAPYRSLADENGVDGRVRFAGSSNAPEGWLADALALVLPTSEDVWGMVLHEAMAASVPVITSGAAGAGGLIADAGAGIVVPSDDPRDLAAAVDSLLRSPGRVVETGARGRELAERLNRTSQEAIVRAFERQATSR